MRTGLRDSAVRRVQSAAARWLGVGRDGEWRGWDPSGGGPMGTTCALGTHQLCARSVEISLTPISLLSIKPSTPWSQMGGKVWRQHLSATLLFPSLGKTQQGKAVPTRPGRAPSAAGGAGGAGGCCPMVLVGSVGQEDAALWCWWDWCRSARRSLLCNMMVPFTISCLLSPWERLLSGRR